MEPTPRSDLPPEFELRLQQAKALSGALRDRALQQLSRDFPEHAAWLSRLLGVEQSQVVLGSGDESSVQERLRRLAARGTAGAGRYELHGEVARGGMGAILRAFDQDLGRSLAMKVILGEREGEGGGGDVDAQVLERFVEEAQITGQLDHPGVVPVHELGLDAKGHVYFTMRLVKGITAQDVFALTRSRAEGWTLTRALEVLLKVCDTLAYAHSKGVVHRDLKPSNVMVGRYGEVYVMDWGLAKVLGQKDAHDLRIRPPESTSMSRVRTDRSKEHESDPDTALRTMDGAIVGTPCYMPPEQAHGHVEHVGVRSDVYAAGAMLYTLLTGAQPYIRSGSKTSPYMVLELVRSGPPVPVHQLDRAAPVELVAICERAMARKMEARYASMGELADDLRAFLENRVVRAYRTGARAELASWVRRNRGMAFGLLTAAVALVLGGAGALVYAGQAATALGIAETEKGHAEDERGRANTARLVAEKALEDFQAAQRRKEELEEKLRKDRVREAVRRAEEGGQAQAAIEGVQEALAIERLRAIDLQLETIASGSNAVPAAADRAEVGFGPWLRQAFEWQDGKRWVSFLRGSGALVQRRAAGALAELGGALRPVDALQRVDKYSPALRVAVHGAIATAHLQRGDAIAGLRAHLAAAKAGAAAPKLVDPDTDERFHSMLCNYEREAAWVLLEAAEARAWSSDFAQVAESWPHKPRWSKAPRVMEAARSLVAGDCLWVSQDDVLQASAPEVSAFALRRLGLVGAAIRNARGHREQAPLPLRTALVVEEARAWLATHRPQRALALLDGHLAKYRAGSGFLPQFWPLHELRAQSLALLGQHEQALDALTAAGAMASADAATRHRLALLRGDVLRRLGQPAAALEAYAGRPVAVIAANLETLPLGTRLRIATTARLAGNPDLVAAALRSAAAARASLPERIEVLMHQARSFSERRQPEAAKVLDTLDSLLTSVADPWILARARVQLAVGLVALGRGGAALPQLDRAARSLQEWLLDYGRFHGEPLTAAQIEVLEELGRSAVGALVDLAGLVQPEDMAAVWRVVETFRSPVDVALGTRPDTLQAPGLDPVSYETARAKWLSRHLPAETPPVTAVRSDRAAGYTVTSETLQQSEERLRLRWPAYIGAVLPRVPSLPDARRALPEGTALAVFATSGDRAVAFVLTRGGASLVPLSIPAGMLAVGSPESHERWAANLVAPVLACSALADAAAWRRLLIAPVGDLAQVPFEWCPVAAPGPAGSEQKPLLLHCDVAYVPSGTAWFDQRLSQQGARPPAAQTGVALLGPDEPALPHVAAASDGLAGRQWITSALSPALADGRELQLRAGPDANAETLRQAAAAAGVIGLVLRVELPAARSMGTLVVAGRSRAPDEHIARQDLRDLGAVAGLAVVRALPTTFAVDAEAETLAGFARGLWSAGAGTVVTMSGYRPPEPGGNLVAAVAAAQRNGGDSVAAWCEAARQMLGRGVPIASLCGLRLWSVNPWNPR